MNTNKFRSLLNIINLLILVSLAFVPLHASAQIPVTGELGSGSTAPVNTSPSLALFVEQVKNGSTQQITGLYIENLFSYPVIQQPGGQPAYVSSKYNLVTQFGSASAFGSLGILAHNTLAGKKFSEIKKSDLITIVYGDGRTLQYQVTQIRSFQAVSPNNPTSSFIDLSTNQTLTVEEVFYQTYGVKDQLILQTCISFHQLDTWGRLFVVAVPYTPATIENASHRIPATIEL